MKTDNHILSRLSGSEVLVHPEQKEWFESCIRAVVGHARAEELTADYISQANNEDGFWPAPDDWRAVYRPYVVKGNVLQIPVFGVLLNRFAYQVGRYATGYTYLERAFERGMGDSEVKGIAWIHDSPGGEVAGNFELVDKIFARRGEKPMKAFAAESMYSASYSIGSAADSIDITRTGGVGSIGVVTAHVDYSGMFDKVGIKVTFVFAGKHKVDGNPYEALSPTAKKRMQKRIDRIYGIFTSTVARNREMDEDAVRATEAETYSADEAIDVGLADRVGVFEESLEAFARSLEVENDETATGARDMTTFTQAQMDAKISEAVAQEAAKHSSVATAAKAQGEADAKTRITSILGCDEAKKRPKAAMSCAMKTDLPLDAAKAFLGDLPEEAIAAPGKHSEGNATAFIDAMSKDTPAVGAGGDKSKPEGEKAGADDTNVLLNDYESTVGKSFKK